MGIPFEKNPAAHHDNPAGMDGMAFVEFAAVDPQPLARLFEKLGFKRVSEMAGRDITFWRQGGVDIILNADSQTHGGTFAALHGPCISAIAFHVSNAKAAFERAIQMVRRSMVMRRARASSMPPH